MVAFGAARAVVVELLGDDDAYLARIERVILDVERPARVVVQAAHAGRCFEIDARKIEPLGLAQLEFDGFTVFDGLADLGVGLDGDRNRLLERQGARTPARKHRCSHQETQQSPDRRHTPTVHKTHPILAHDALSNAAPCLFQ